MNKNQILQTDRRNLWHPFTQDKDYENISPPVIVRGKGIFLWDADGNKYYDTISSWWSNLLGHSHPLLNKALVTQAKILEHVNFSGFTHPYATNLVAELKNFIDPRLSRFFFSDNGSTSVEVALKMAFQYFQNQNQKTKTSFVMLNNGYHGDTLGAMSVGGIDSYFKLFKPLMFSTYKAGSPNCSLCKKRKSAFTYDAKNTGCKIECFKHIEKILKKNHAKIAAVIIEPLLQSAGGMLIYPPEYLEKLRLLTEKLDIILIFDEVATGFGRTGTFFAYNQTKIIPDIICLSKSLTAGYMPLALTVTTEKIYSAFCAEYSEGKTFFHGHSYTANPLACAVATENLKILQQKNLPQSKIETMRYFHKILQSLAKYDFIGDIRYLGFIGAVDIVKSRSQKQFFAEDERIGFKIYLASLKSGLVLRPLVNTIYWFLPLITTKSDISKIIDKSVQVFLDVLYDPKK